MRTFEVASSHGSLGSCRVTPENIEKFRADFSAWLEQGVVLTGVTATVTSALSTVSGAAMSSNRKAATWLLDTTATEEDFELTLTITTNDGQTLQYTVNYIVG